jgi:predicted DNA-binding transcriptional regulator AlpA
MPGDLKGSLVDVKAAARLLGLSESTLNKWRLRGEGPVFVRMGRAIRYCPPDLDEWVKSNRRRSTSGSGGEG